MAGLSPTQRSMKYFRDQGLICGQVERWVPSPKHPGGGFRKDFLGIIDMIFLGPDGIVGVQSCGQDFAGHKHKIFSDDHIDDLRSWLEAGGKFVLVGWRKLKAVRGGRRMVWTPRIEEYTLKDLESFDES